MLLCLTPDNFTCQGESACTQWVNIQFLQFMLFDYNFMSVASCESSECFKFNIQTLPGDNLILSTFIFWAIKIHIGELYFPICMHVIRKEA